MKDIPTGPASSPADASRQPGKLGAATRARILDTAERLFAEHGLDAVSLRRICEISDVNTAAIHYHFGTKRELVTAILERGLPHWEENRDTYLSPLESADEVTLDEILQAMVLPVVRISQDEEQRTFLRFLVMVSSHPQYTSLFESKRDEYTQRHLRLLEKAAPELPRPVREWRYALTRGFLYYTLIFSSDPLGSWLDDEGVTQSEDFRNDLVRYFAGALGAPSGETST